MSRRILFIVIMIIIVFFFASLGCNKNNTSDIPEDNTPTCMDRAIFGDPSQSEYILPFPAGKTYRMSQGNCFPRGGHSNQLAYDFDMAIGDEIIASRGGIIRETKDTSPDDGLINGNHNYIFIEHEDGTLAFYAHLKQNGLYVQVGDQVEAGEVIALSGNSGLTGGPHLHFGVYQFYPPREGFDVPVNFRNADGPLDDLGGLMMGYSYTAR